jgi:acetyl/propionyl-CoA carboxylase alpha subunit
VRAETREAAIERAIAALGRYIVLGIRTNITFLLNILDSAAFRSGQVHTGFLDSEGAHLREASVADLPPAALAAVMVHQETARSSSGRGRTAARVADPFDTIRGWGPR